MPTESRYRGPTENEVKRSIAAWVRDYLDRTGTKPVDLARDLGVSEATISNIRKGKLLPGFKMLVRLHFGIGATLSEVLRHKTRIPAHHAAGTPTDQRPGQKLSQ